MINTKKFFKILKKKINFYCGVPDSVLKNFTNILSNNKKIKNIITANEGAAISLASGYYLSKRKIAAVYLQNSGLGNSINPIISICHKKVYSIPLLMIIGWRGAPNKKDEPQHEVKGAITKDLLKLLNVKFLQIDSDRDLKKIPKLINYAMKNSSPVALLIKKDTLKFVKLIKKKEKNNQIQRIEFLKNFLSKIGKNDLVFSSTGYTSREINFLREKYKKNIKGKHFYMVGGMGHNSMFALGAAIKSNKKIYCIDGDGSFIMHLGSFLTLSNYYRSNIKYLVLNNGSHESVGGQKTFIEKINLQKFIKSFNFGIYFEISKSGQINKTLEKFIKSKQKSFLNIIIQEGSIKNLGRPKNLKTVKCEFMR